MKKGKFEVINLPNKQTHFVHPRWGELNFNTINEKGLEALYSRKCPYVRLAKADKPKQEEGKK